MAYPQKSRLPIKLKAFVAVGGNLSINDRNVTQLLDFFGIPWEIVTVDQLTSAGGVPKNGDWDKCCIVSSAAVMAAVLDASRESVAWLTQKISSVYVYGFQNVESCKRLFRYVTNNENADISSLGSLSSPFSITGELPELCGPMSGLRVLVSPENGDQVFRFHGGSEEFQQIVSTSEGAIFARVAFEGIPFYLNACLDVINIDSPAREYFDVKKCFGSAVPITMYLKWAFAGVCWANTETNACLIVDDPLLKARYGFLYFRRALELMDEHGFTMSLAFIPWNWRRADSNVVRMFQDRRDRLSLSVHGCDHTAREFATRSDAELNARTKIAARRMEGLHQKTSLPHDRIMIFPQGEFAPEVGQILKLNGFLAAVNTEVAPSGGSGNRTKIADLWDVAINSYGSFPIFTRRYVTHGIENFAFDILLGKPCFLVAHHDAFKDGGRALVALIDELNSLQCKPVWTNLGDAVSRSARSRVRGDGTNIVQVYANRAFVKNVSSEPRAMEIIKEESQPNCVRAVTVNDEVVSWDHEAGRLRFTITIPPKQTTEIRVLYDDNLGEGIYPSTTGYKVKTGARRFLSEVRDQYVSQSAFLNKSAVTVRRLLK